MDISQIHAGAILDIISIIQFYNHMINLCGYCVGYHGHFKCKPLIYKALCSLTNVLSREYNVDIMVVDNYICVCCKLSMRSCVIIYWILYNMNAGTQNVCLSHKEYWSTVHSPNGYKVTMTTPTRLYDSRITWFRPYHIIITGMRRGNLSYRL